LRGDGESRTPTGFSGPTLFSRQLPAPIGWRLHSLAAAAIFVAARFQVRPAPWIVSRVEEVLVE
jgi:hypothetical protein